MKSLGFLANCSTIVKGLVKKTLNRPRRLSAACHWGAPGFDQKASLPRPPSEVIWSGIRVDGPTVGESV